MGRTRILTNDDEFQILQEDEARKLAKQKKKSEAAERRANKSQAPTPHRGRPPLQISTTVGEVQVRVTTPAPKRPRGRPPLKVSTPAADAQIQKENTVATRLRGRLPLKVSSPTDDAQIQKPRVGSTRLRGRTPLQESNKENVPVDEIDSSRRKTTRSGKKYRLHAIISCLNF